ncbi:MAG: SDR family NAD(P)-dependent oxidoreductase [Bacteroidetes bacterium]|nr:MAG: SDR family NAD(P)-dependent oxidoreductase [Bacteroidota bacterium]
MELFDLSGKVAIVTGTSGILGPIWVETLEDAGCEVFRIDIPTYDVTSKHDVYLAKRECIYRYGGVDIIVNNAAIDTPPGSVSSFFGNFEEIMKVNICGAVNITEIFLPHMGQGGVVINIGSIQGNIGACIENYEDGFEKPVGYNCSKAALIQLSRSITTQYGRYGIRSVTIAFSAYDSGKLPKNFIKRFTETIPLRKTVSKESLQTTLLYACCCPDLAGTQVLVDSGYTAR